jgi:hypothetical protein
VHEPIHTGLVKLSPLFLVSVLVLSYCSRHAEQGEPGVVALIDGEPVTAGDLRERFWRGTGEERLRSLKAGGRHFLLERVITDRLLAGEARRRGLSPRYADIEDFHKNLMKRFLDDEFEPTMRPESFSDELVAVEYERLRPDLVVPERRLLRILAQPSEERADEVIALFEDKVAAQDGRELYRMLNDENLRVKGGGKGRFARDEVEGYLEEDLADIAFALDPSKVVHHEPVKFRGRWAILVVEEVSEPRSAPALDEIEDQIRQRLLSERRDDALNSFVDSFRKNHDVIVNDDVVDLVPWVGEADWSSSQ